MASTLVEVKKVKTACEMRLLDIRTSRECERRDKISRELPIDVFIWRIFGGWLTFGLWTKPTWKSLEEKWSIEAFRYHFGELEMRLKRIQRAAQLSDEQTMLITDKDIEDLQL